MNHSWMKSCSNSQQSDSLKQAFLSFEVSVVGCFNGSIRASISLVCCGEHMRYYIKNT